MKYKTLIKLYAFGGQMTFGMLAILVQDAVWSLFFLFWMFVFLFNDKWYWRMFKSEARKREMDV